MGMIAIGGAALPEPTEYGVEEESVGRFERNANGKLVGDLVGVKTRVNCGWKMLEDRYFQTILSAARQHFVTAAYYDPAKGAALTAEMAVTARGGRLAVCRGGEKWWGDVSLGLIER